MRRLIFPTFATLVISTFVAFTVLTTDSQAASSIVTRLSPDHTQVEVVSEPEGTASINVAILNASQTETKYLWPRLPASQTFYKPPSGYPVVDMEARGSSGQSLGSWAGRLTTTPGGVKEEPKEPPKEPPAEEPKEPPPPPPPSEMAVGLDTGGWAWESVINDFAGAVKFIRSNAYNYRDDTHMGYLAKAGVTLLPLFEDRGNGSPPQDPSAEVLTWFKRYGKGGTYWAGRTDLGATTAEIINEPDNPYFWCSARKPNPCGEQARYASIIEHVAATLKGGLPSGQPQPRLLVSYDGGYQGDSYGRSLISADPNLLKLNLGFTVHPYGGHGSNSALGGRSRVTESLRPVYVTEVGFPTAVGQPPTGDSLQWTQQQQAENIKGFIDWSRSLGYVGAVVVFNYRDYGSNYWYGIESASGVRKLSYAALKAESGR